MLLMRIKGATSFNDLRTVDGKLYETFKEACDALGLLKDDNQWSEALRENARTAFPSQIRALFVHILTNCPVADPRKMWNENWTYMSDDILYSRRKKSGNIELTLSEYEVENYALAGNFIFEFSEYNIYCLIYVNKNNIYINTKLFKALRQHVLLFQS